MKSLILISFLFLFSPHLWAQPAVVEPASEDKNLKWLEIETNRILNRNKPEDVKAISLCMESKGGFELSIIRKGFRETYSSFLDQLDYSG